MRSDYALYGVGIIFFVITAFSLIVLGGVEQSLSVVTTVVLGILFVGLGFTLRPSTKTARATAPTAPTAPTPVAIETPIKEEKGAVVETECTTLELQSVKG